MDAGAVLRRFLELAGGSAAYFVSGSLSFLPRLARYREPEHDLDVAVESTLYAAIERRLGRSDAVHVLSLSEIALAESSSLARLLPGGTAFVHVTTPDGLLDLAHYGLAPTGLRFRLGPGLGLVLPRSVLDRVATLTWDGLPFRAGPIELAFVPKALAFDREPGSLPPHHVEDLRRLAPLVDRGFLAEIARFRPLRIFGRPLPRRLDPSTRLVEIADRLH